MLENDLIRKLRLIAKFMTSQFGQQIITIQILTNISKRKENLAMKFGQLIEYKRNIFFKNHTENEAGRLVPDLSFSKKLYIR